MKIAVLADTHFGIKNDSTYMLDYQEKFFEDFFNYCLEHDIREIIHLGDFFDRRRHVNFNTLNRVRKMFLAPVREYGFHVHIILGNHDCFHKSTVDVNSVNEIFSEYPEIEIVDTPRHVRDIGVMCPWITEENRDEVMNILDLYHGKGHNLFGHFEIDGYDIGAGQTYISGVDKHTMMGYENPLSGHFHNHSEWYVGCPYQLTWADFMEEKGFVVVDTDTKKWEFVKNRHKLYTKIHYDDSKHDYLQEFEPSDVENKIIRIVIEECNDDLTFFAFIDMIEKSAAIEVDIVDPRISIVAEDTTDNFDATTLELIGDYVDALGGEFDRDGVKAFLKRLYLEAENL